MSLSIYFKEDQQSHQRCAPDTCNWPVHTLILCIYTGTQTHPLSISRLSGPQSLNSLEVYACHILNIRARWMLLLAWKSGALDKTAKEKKELIKLTKKKIPAGNFTQAHYSNKNGMNHTNTTGKMKNCDKWEIVQEMVPISTLPAGSKE